MIKLDKIQNPTFLKGLTTTELYALAREMRQCILDVVSQNGGHLSANLGMIEATIALHIAFSGDNDKILFDVGHQTYAHKILTGRYKSFGSLRKRDGLSGFLKYDESIYDHWEGGHSSTALSAACGLFEVKNADVTSIGEIVIVIGDGAIQNGIAFVAMNNLAEYKDNKAIIVLNDNGMIISKGKASFSKRIKKMVSAFGFAYYGPVDGHDIEAMEDAFKYAKSEMKTVVVHLKTKKGYGYKYAETDEIGIWHGVSKFDLKTGIQNEQLDCNSWSNQMGLLLEDKCKRNSKIRILCPAMVPNSGLSDLKQKFPDKVIDHGIAEDHTIIMASAMAHYGLKPIVVIYSTFLQRAYDQLNNDISLQQANVIFLIDRAGIVGEDGETHQGIFDVAILSHLPNFVITMPSNLNEAEGLMDYALNNTGPIAIRYPKDNIERTNDEINIVRHGKWIVKRPICDINIIAYGPVVNEFDQKLSNRNIGLINALFIKPFDSDMLYLLNNKQIIIYEEVIESGSLGEAIINYISRNNLQIKTKLINLGDRYIPQGKTDELKKEFGLQVDEIINKL